MNHPTPVLKRYITPKHRRIEPTKPLNLPVINSPTGLKCPICDPNIYSQLYYRTPYPREPTNIAWAVSSLLALIF